MKISKSKAEKIWHEHYCDCRGSMKGKSVMCLDIDRPTTVFQDFKRRATDNQHDDVLDYLKKLGVKIED